MAQIKTILVTTDFSENSETAFLAARELALRFEARVVLAHVEELQLPFVVVEGYATALHQGAQERRVRAGDSLARYAAKYFVPNVDVKLELLAGLPHVEIVRLASACDADLIVMATHGRGFVSHAILGSTTERVLRRAPCPVFVVRDPHEGRQVSAAS